MWWSFVNKWNGSNLWRCCFYLRYDWNFPNLENVATLSKLSVTNVFFFQCFGETHAWDVFSSWIICEKCFKFLCFKQFSVKVSLGLWWLFLNCYLAALRLTLGHYWRDSLTLLILIITFLQFWLECQGSLEWGWARKPGQAPLGFEPVTYRF